MDSRASWWNRQAPICNVSPLLSLLRATTRWLEQWEMPVEAPQSHTAPLRFVEAPVEAPKAASSPRQAAVKPEPIDVSTLPDTMSSAEFVRLFGADGIKSSGVSFKKYASG